MSERVFPIRSERLIGRTPHDEPGPYCACDDCGRKYGDEYGFPDLMIPDEAWRLISPTGADGGLLCPSCIVRRCAQQGILCEARWGSGPFNDDIRHVRYGEVRPNPHSHRIAPNSESPNQPSTNDSRQGERG